jgi:twitching motility protein PilJ
MSRMSSASRATRLGVIAVLLSLFLIGCVPPPPPPMEAILLTAGVPGQALQLGALARDAARGNVMAFDDLREGQERLRNNLGTLQAGDASRGMAPPGPEREPQVRSLQSAWSEADLAITRLLALQEVIENSADHASMLSMQVPPFQARADELFRSLTEAGAPAAHVVLANRLLMLPERMLRRLSSALSGGPDAVTAYDALSRDCSMLQGSATALREGRTAEDVPALSHPRALEALGELDKLLPEMQQACAALVAEAHLQFEANELVDQISFHAARLQDEALALLQAYR